MDETLVLLTAIKRIKDCTSSWLSRLHPLFPWKKDAWIYHILSAITNTNIIYFLIKAPLDNFAGVVSQNEKEESYVPSRSQQLVCTTQCFPFELYMSAVFRGKKSKVIYRPQIWPAYLLSTNLWQARCQKKRLDQVPLWQWMKNPLYKTMITIRSTDNTACPIGQPVSSTGNKLWNYFLYSSAIDEDRLQHLQFHAVALTIEHAWTHCVGGGKFLARRPPINHTKHRLSTSFPLRKSDGFCTKCVAIWRFLLGPRKENIQLETTKQLLDQPCIKHGGSDGHWTMPRCDEQSHKTLLIKM